MGIILWTLGGFIVGFIAGIIACAWLDERGNGDTKSPYGYY